MSTRRVSLALDRIVSQIRSLERRLDWLGEVLRVLLTLGNALLHRLRHFWLSCTLCRRRSGLCDLLRLLVLLLLALLGSALVLVPAASLLLLERLIRLLCSLPRRYSLLGDLRCADLLLVLLLSPDGLWSQFRFDSRCRCPLCSQRASTTGRTSTAQISH